jgi:hypothetical protein
VASSEKLKKPNIPEKFHKLETLLKYFPQKFSAKYDQNYAANTSGGNISF